MDDWLDGLPPQFGEIRDAVKADIKAKLGALNNGPGVIESFTAFVHAVDWKVSWWLVADGSGAPVAWMAVRIERCGA